MTGRLTTHALDTARGRPAADLSVELFRIEGETRRSLTSASTNADGRTDAPLLEGDELESGTYEIFFGVGEYFAGTEDVADPPFLDRVPIRFSVAEPSAHYHVPLLVSPWAYTTYRGS
ncbi:MAG TPA: hydroxyisourate hydrolase [Rubrobacteraceae bacterium]|nr:hydroxyisourate hydrolase [Rubrobacteraceae bacterium]